VKQVIQKALRHLGYEIHRIGSGAQEHFQEKEGGWINEPPPINPIWPLPRRPSGLSNDHIRAEFAKYDLWHYAYAFEGGFHFRRALMIRANWLMLLNGYYSASGISCRI
jgi:hypothetical protein